MYKQFIYFQITAVNQYYEAQVYDLFVIKGNAAVFKCNIPSFVSDHVEITSWHDTEGGEYSSVSDYGILYIRIFFSKSTIIKYGTTHLLSD